MFVTFKSDSYVRPDPNSSNNIVRKLLTSYPINPHTSTCAYNKDNQSLEIVHCAKGTDISTCAYVKTTSKMYIRNLLEQDKPSTQNKYR